MTTVNVDFLSDYYTWESCPRTWAQMEFAWEDAGIRTFGLSADEPLLLGEAIKKDRTEQFIHVIGTNNLREILPEVRLLGLERIPRNFLLNKQKEICRKYENIQTIDLTKAFTKIEKESHVNLDDHFRIPDILLSSENGFKDIHLWVEIWVKHETEAKKRAEGSILEIKVSSENDLKPIREHRITVTGKGNQARIFNADFPEECILEEYTHDTTTCLDLEICPSSADKKIFIRRKQVFKRKHTPPQYDKPVDLSKIEWMDLGLPSGVLWAKDDEDVLVTIHKALQDYPDNLPSESDAKELREYCSRQFDSAKKEMIFTGPNGNSVSFKCTDKYTSYWLNEYESKYRDYGKCFHLSPDNSFYINNKDSNTPIHIHLVCRHDK